MRVRLANDELSSKNHSAEAGGGYYQYQRSHNDVQLQVLSTFQTHPLCIPRSALYDYLLKTAAARYFVVTDKRVIDT